MAFYINLAATSLRLVTRYGTTATLGRKSAGTFNPVTGSYSGAQTNTTGTIRCVVLTYTVEGVKQLFTGETRADNGIMEAFKQGRLRKLIIAASGAPFEPAAGDTVTGLESAEWTVLGVNPLKPDQTTPLIYTAAISRK